MSKIYKGARHSGYLFDERYKYHANFQNDLEEFYRTGIQGNGFHDDDSSAIKIKLNPDLSVDER